MLRPFFRTVPFPWLRRRIFYELLVLCIFLTVLSPYRDRHLAVYEETKRVAVRNVDVALGLEHRGIFPCFSLPFAAALFEEIPKNPDAFLTLNLREAFPPEFYPDHPNELPFFRGGEPGMALGIHALWAQSGVFTLGILVAVLKVLHLGSVFCLFALISLLNLPLAALVMSLAYAYSPAVLQTVDGFTPYLFAPAACIIASLLIALGRPVKERHWPFFIRVCCVSLAGVVLISASFCRTTILLTAIPLSLGLIASILASRRRREWVLVASLLLTLTAGQLFWNRIIWTPHRLALAHEQKTHLFWHQLWMGLGEFPNPYGFVWSDLAAFAKARKISPDVALSSAAYEQVMKTEVVGQIREHPGWFLGVLAKRLLRFSQIWVELLSFSLKKHALFSSALFFAGMIGGGFFIWRSRDAQAFYVLLPFLFDLGIPLLVFSSNYFYNVTAYLGVLLALTYFVVSGSQAFVRRHARNP